MKNQDNQANQNNQGSDNMPPLRFPEFQGDWEKKKLGEVAGKRIIKNKGLKIKNVFTNSANFGIVNQRDFFDKDIANQNNLEGYYVVELDDFIYNPRISNAAPVGPISRNKIGIGVMSPLYNVFRFNEGNLNFIEMFFNTKIWHTHMEEIANYGARADRMSFPIESFYEMPISFPTLPEQTKIANFLTAVDEKIQALKKKHKLLAQYKKGVMQGIFSSELGFVGLEDDRIDDEKNPTILQSKKSQFRQLRFKDENGNDFPAWEVKKLGEVLIKNSTKNKNQKYSLVQSVSNKHGFINQDEMFEDRRVASKDTSNYYVIEKGHFAYNPSRIDVGSLAYKYDEEISVISPLYISFKANQGFLTDNFLLNWFSTEQFQMQMNNSFEGSVRNTLSYESLIKMEISIPCLEEQTLIANFLSALDEKLKQTQTQIEKMEVWKKGLLQKMFV